MIDFHGIFDVLWMLFCVSAIVICSIHAVTDRDNLPSL